MKFFLFATFTLLLSGCASDQSIIYSVKSATVPEWAPLSVENQVGFWDCLKTDWVVEEKYSGYHVVSATCSSVRSSTENALFRHKICMNAIEYRAQCTESFSTEEKIQFRFLVHNDRKVDTVSLFSIREMRLYNERVVSERQLSRAEVQYGSREQTSQMLTDALQKLAEKGPRIDDYWATWILSKNISAHPLDPSLEAITQEIRSRVAQTEKRRRLAATNEIEEAI